MTTLKIEGKITNVYNLNNATKVDAMVMLRQIRGISVIVGEGRAYEKERVEGLKMLASGIESRDSVIGSFLSRNSEKDGPFVCEIFTESKNTNNSFSIQGCSHAYCTDCVVKYVVSKLEENITSIRCPFPDLEPEHCRYILHEDVFDRWAVAICEAMIPGAQKFYCPYKDCSALLINDCGEVIKKSQCAHCRRMFCAQCNVPWHEGIHCIEFQSLNKGKMGWEDIMLMELAEKMECKRCPNCMYYVERRDGCAHMKFRCGLAFCYKCGAQYYNRSHMFPVCGH